MTVAQIIVSDVVSLRDRGKYQGILVRANHLDSEYYFKCEYLPMQEY